MRTCFEKSTTCCFAGYGPDQLSYGSDETHPLCEELKCVFADEIIHAFNNGCTHFITCLSPGTETWFAEVALFMKRIHPEISLECVLSAKQYDRIIRNEISRTGMILRRCGTVTVVEAFRSGLGFRKRKRYLIDRSSLLIGACGGLPGVSRRLVNCARRQGLGVVLIDPEKPGNITRETASEARRPGLSRRTP